MRSFWHGVRVMRCMVCGEEMRVVQTVPDETMPVPGFAHNILSCPCCHDEERRLVFIREPAPLSPPIDPPSETHELNQALPDATLQPAGNTGNTGATDGAPQESSSVSLTEPFPLESMHVPLAEPPISHNAPLANSSALSSSALPHRTRWKALCDRLGLRVVGGKADVSRGE
jgi:hypothetical protein